MGAPYSCDPRPFGIVLVRTVRQSVEHQEVGPSRRRCRNPLAGGRGQVEAARYADARVVGLEDWKNRLDRISDATVVGYEFLLDDSLPGAEGGAGKAADDAALPPPIPACGRLHAQQRL